MNAGAAFVVADGAAAGLGVAAERHAAARAGGRFRPDLRPLRAVARDGLRLYILGGAEGVAEEAARWLSARYPGVQVVGTESPPFRELTDEENAAVKARGPGAVAARPDPRLDDAQGGALDRGTTGTWASPSASTWAPRSTSRPAA